MNAFSRLTAFLLLMTLPVVIAFAHTNQGNDEKEKDKIVIIFHPTPSPLIDYEQYQLFQPLDSLDFDKEVLKSESQQSSAAEPGHLPVFTPSFEGSLRIKEPENAEKGFLLIKKPLVPGQD